jgi:Protein of unknown function (DUF4199)
MATGKKNYILTYGIIGGLISIFWFIVLYVMGPEAFVGPFAYAGMLVGLIAPVLGLMAQKKSQDGYLEFSEGLKTSFGIMVVGSILATLFFYILVNFIDTPFKESLNQVAAENAAKMTKKFGGSDEMAENAMQQTLKKDNYSLSALGLQFAFGCIVSFLIALILSAILKKKRPEFNS